MFLQLVGRRRQTLTISLFFVFSELCVPGKRGLDLLDPASTV
jgi:hypothetical protein